VLPPQAHFYQRLLALDEDEARAVADQFTKEKSTLELYDSVIIPALRLAEEDRHQDELDEEREAFVYRATRDLIEEIGERDLPVEGEPLRPSGRKVLCVGARDEADELVALMLAQLLRDDGHSVDLIKADQFDSRLTSAGEDQYDTLFISALPPFGLSQARALCRKSQRLHAKVKVIVGFWDATADVPSIRERLGAQCFDDFVTNLAAARSLVIADRPNEVVIPTALLPSEAAAPETLNRVKNPAFS
jgi:hypothetical protein